MKEFSYRDQIVQLNKLIYNDIKTKKQDKLVNTPTQDKYYGIKVNNGVITYGETGGGGISSHLYRHTYTLAMSNHRLNIFIDDNDSTKYTNKTDAWNHVVNYLYNKGFSNTDNCYVCTGRNGTNNVGLRCCCRITTSSTVQIQAFDTSSGSAVFENNSYLTVYTCPVIQLI